MARKQAKAIGQSPNQGHSPDQFRWAYGGAEPRLTSGGEAGAVCAAHSDDPLLSDRQY